MNRVMQCAAGLILAFLVQQPARAVDVRAVRLWAGPDSTRVVVDLSGSAQHSLQVLHNPERVVLDVPGARLAKTLHAVPKGSGAVKRVRMSHSPSGNLRVVLDLSRPIQAKSFLTTPNAHYGYRLVVDLAGAGAGAGAAAAAGGGSGRRVGVARVDKPVKAKHA